MISEILLTLFLCVISSQLANATPPNKLTAYDGTSNDNFGRYLTFFEDTLVVSSVYDDDKGGNTGNVWF